MSRFLWFGAFIHQISFAPRLARAKEPITPLSCRCFLQLVEGGKASSEGPASILHDARWCRSKPPLRTSRFRKVSGSELFSGKVSRKFAEVITDMRSIASQWSRAAVAALQVEHIARCNTTKKSFCSQLLSSDPRIEYPRISVRKRRRSSLPTTIHQGHNNSHEGIIFTNR
jgi:hypothetical protein